MSSLKTLKNSHQESPDFSLDKKNEIINHSRLYSEPKASSSGHVLASTTPETSLPKLTSHSAGSTNNNQKTNISDANNEKVNTIQASNYKSHHIHQYQKIQNYEDSMKFKHNLIKEIVQLVKENDHNSLAYLARTCGIPPQLRHLVWPILLKYHPFVLCPNIMTNTLQFSINHEELKEDIDKSSMEKVNNKEDSDKENINANKPTHHIIWDYKHEEKSETDIITSIKKDISKYIMVKHEDDELVDLVVSCVMKFLKKWGKIFKYETGLTWVCLSLMEWCSPYSFDESTSSLNVLPGRSFYRSTHSQNTSSNKHSSSETTLKVSNDVVNDKKEKILSRISRNLFLDYPLVGDLAAVYSDPNLNLLARRTTFAELFEKTLLVFLHAPDLKTIIENKESKLSQDYSPVISGGDFNFNQNLFYKMFEDCFPDLYQPFIEQLSSVINTSQTSWMYYWLKFASVRTFNKSDRARFWDLMFGWRANPVNLDFFLKYKKDNLNITHFYKNEMPERWLKAEKTGEFSLKQQLEKYCNKNEDYFWFPDLNQMKFDKSTLDFYIFEELLKRNKQSDERPNGNSESDSLTANENSKAEKEHGAANTGQKIGDINQFSQVHNQTKKSSNVFPYSLIDLHTQQILIYLTILHKNEFKLLEYEEREVLEFLNNVPILSKYDDLMYRNLASYSFDSSNNGSDVFEKESITSFNSETNMKSLGNNANYDGKAAVLDASYRSLQAYLSPVSSNQSFTAPLKSTESDLLERYGSKSGSIVSNLLVNGAHPTANDVHLNNPLLASSNLVLQQPDISKLSSSQTLPVAPQHLNNPRKSQSYDVVSHNNSQMNSLADKASSVYNGDDVPADSKKSRAKKIEFGSDDKTLQSFNELLSGSGDIWRRWAYQELEQNNT